MPDFLGRFGRRGFHFSSYFAIDSVGMPVAACNGKAWQETTHIENVFICMASPLMIAALVHGKTIDKILLFCLAGMGVVVLRWYQYFLPRFMVRITFCRHWVRLPCGGGGHEALPLLFIF